MGWKSYPMMAVLSSRVLIFLFRFLIKTNWGYLSDFINPLVKGFLWPSIESKNPVIDSVIGLFLNSCDKKEEGEWKNFQETVWKFKNKHYISPNSLTEKVTVSIQIMTEMPKALYIKFLGFGKV